MWCHLWVIELHKQLENIPPITAEHGVRGSICDHPGLQFFSWCKCIKIKKKLSVSPVFIHSNTWSRVNGRTLCFAESLLPASLPAFVAQPFSILWLYKKLILEDAQSVTVCVAHLLFMWLLCFCFYSCFSLSSCSSGSVPPHPIPRRHYLSFSVLYTQRRCVGPSSVHCALHITRVCFFPSTSSLVGIFTASSAFCFSFVKIN